MVPPQTETMVPPQTETMVPPQTETMVPPQAETMVPPQAETMVPPTLSSVSSNLLSNEAVTDDVTRRRLEEIKHSALTACKATNSVSPEKDDTAVAREANTQTTDTLAQPKL